VETAIRSGDNIPPDYDPLVAKILVVDEDRERALARLARALDETVVTGIQTTLPFHRFIATDATFRAGPPPIDWVDGHWAADLRPGRAAALEAARWAAARVPAALDHSADTAARVDAVVPEAAPWVRAGRLRAVERWPGSTR
jgi:acetyl/propionyl-CoA carboxylase alpha subunit